MTQRIPRKALAATVVTAAITLLATLLALQGRTSGRATEQQTLERAAAVAGTGLSDALRSRDAQTARQFITASRADAGMVTAAVYTPDGKLFAGWSRSNTSPPAKSIEQAHAPIPGSVEVFHPIRYDGDVLGTIYLAQEAERSSIAANITLAAIAALMVAAIAAWLLKRLISDPITALAGVARDVSRSRNFSLRARITSKDEIGDLVERFNSMLGEIEEAHAEVRHHRDRLEEDVMLRTSELGATNALLSASKQVAEAAARANAELSQKNRLILDSAREGIFGLDAGGCVTFINPAAERILGFSPGDLLGRSLHPLLHPPSARPSTEEQCGVCRPNENGAANRRAVFQTSSNTPIPVEYTSAATRDGGVVVTFRDIRERLAVEQMKDEFLSTVSHELRTPLTSIRGALGLLSNGLFDSSGNPKAQRMFEIATRNTDRLIRLVSDILDAERLTSGRVDLRQANIETADVMRQAGDVMQGLADRSGVRIEVEPLEEMIFADPDRVMQMLTNLLSNAIKFSPPGEVVRLRAHREESEVILQVIDRGRGIPPDKLDLVFERFKQVDASDAREKGGSGLGLPICRGIAEAHGGRIWVTSELGSGSTFSIAIPVAQRDATQAAA